MTTTHAELITCTPSQLAGDLQTLMEANVPAMIWSDPGLGKSSITAQVAAADGRHLIEYRASLHDPSDLTGLPNFREGRTVFCPPDWLPTTNRGLLFLDELNRTGSMMQNCLMQLVLDRRIGDYRLPDGWWICAAGNYDGGVTKMVPALRERFAHLHLVADLDAWSKWAVKNDIHPATIAYNRFAPASHHRYDRDAVSPNPRAWKFVSDITKASNDPSRELRLFAGKVGNGDAVQYCAFLQMYRALPNLDGILLNPTAAAVPTKVDVLYAVATGLARRANGANLGRVIAYLDRLPAEFGVMAVRDLTTRDALLQTTSEFTNWAIRHSDVTL